MKIPKIKNLSKLIPPVKKAEAFETGSKTPRNLIDEGVTQKLIEFESDKKYISYCNQKIRRNYENPEEKVQADSFLRLIIIYKYPAFWKGN